LTALGFVVGSLSAHRLAGRWGRIAVIVTTAVLSGVFLAWGMTAAMPLLPTVGVLILFGVSQGVRGATSSVLGLRQASRYRGAMMALRASVVQFGYVFGGLIGGGLLGWIGLSGIGIVFAVLIAASGLIMRLLVHDPPESALAP
jgi:predicted MFS family arabinose efflux permease